MAPADLTLRMATPEDTLSILDLVRRSLGEGKVPRQRDYWEWKHFENPFGATPCLLAESEGRLVGLRAFMRWTWRAAGVTVPAVRAVDTATHPEWRGRGIFTRLTLALVDQVRAEGTAMVFNTPNAQSRPGYLKMGWESLGHTPLWVRPLGPRRMIRALLSRSSGSGELDRTRTAGAAVSNLLEEPALSRFLDGLTGAWDRFSTPLTSSYLRWRYSAVPGFEYRALWSLDGEEGAALVFRVKSRKTLAELRLCQVLIGSGDRSRRIGRDLLRSLASDVDAVFATAMAAPGTPARRVLLRAGFVPATRSGPIMTVRPLAAMINGLDPRRRSAWDLSIGDLELF
jgi:GNAT superfamily N-acetyltransferase